MSEPRTPEEQTDNQPNPPEPSEAQEPTKNEKQQSPTGIIIRRFLKNKLAVFGLIMLVLITTVSFSAPLITEHDPTSTDMLNIHADPSSEHILGTNGVGQDNFARLLYGGQISIQIGLYIAAIVTVIGVVLGSLAGYYGGRVDGAIMRFTDLFLVLPFLLLVLTVVTILQETTLTIFVITLGLIVWPNITRILRGTYLSLREQEFVLSAKSIGASDFRIMRKHLLPNAVGPIIVNATVIMAQMIILESALSFLGFGIPEPTPTWGSMLDEARNLGILTGQPHMWLPPGLMIVLTVLSINFIGDALRDAFDPKSKSR
ncbi:peptide/nickel transport system permease protein [Salsuginibacillus halophilus]|uniref:Peptide/nickel transport system permease protein n=1 Tax=Salsuginibacillus halophilus TaxID=517424 RepID=A0A2P8HIG4_9BACI|nr:oligopeptide ABC transporter permease [Salsuginibacillus halophilus]PSL45960.1 peptide/nickel transport system permease protein [Salsuginibacillus halophilus]